LGIEDFAGNMDKFIAEASSALWMIDHGLITERSLSPRPFIISQEIILLGARPCAHLFAETCHGIVIRNWRICMKSEFTAVFEKRGKWYVGYVEEILGVNTQGRTLKETRKNLKEALALILETNRELAEKRLSGQNVVKEPIAVNI
jgi:predicted RNase H-like HicB family nuclease